MDVSSLRSVEAFTTKDGSTIRELHHTGSQSLAEAELAQGQSTQRHYHGATEEIYFIEAGRGEMELDGDRREVTVGDAVGRAAEPTVVKYFDMPVQHIDDGVLKTMRRGHTARTIRETIDMLSAMGYPLNYTYNPVNRVGDHICYISDLRKVRSHFPNWQIEYDLPKIISDIADRRLHVNGAVPVHHNQHV